MCEGGDGASGCERLYIPRPWPMLPVVVEVTRAEIHALCASREGRQEDNLNFFDNDAANSGTSAVSRKRITTAS